MPTLLFVCTGNVCRSPMASAFAQSALARRGEQVTVLSAGVLAPGRRTPPEVTTVMARRGLDVASHRSRRLGDLLAPPPDLIVGMAREHARAVVEVAPELFSRTFTLKDLVNRATRVGPRALGDDLDAYLRRVGDRRSLAGLAGASVADDVADPIRGDLGRYEQCATTVGRLVSTMTDLVWPYRPHLPESRN